MPVWPRKGKAGKGNRWPLGVSQSTRPCTPPHSLFPVLQYYHLNALGFESKCAPRLMVSARTIFPAKGPAQPAFPSARLSQGQMTSFSVVWSPDSPAPGSSESIRQGPLSVGISILIWKKLQTQKGTSKEAEGQEIPHVIAGQQEIPPRDHGTAGNHAYVIPTVPGTSMPQTLIQSGVCSHWLWGLL